MGRVFLDLYGGTGDTAADRALRQRLDQTIAALVGGAFSVPLAERAVASVKRVAGVRDAHYALFASERPGEVILVVTATLGGETLPVPRDAPPGKRTEGLPILVEDERQLLRVQLGSGFGLYNDHNPWFASPETYADRSPVAVDTPGAGNATWAEAWVEYGLAGAAQVGDTRTYVFGEITGLTSGSTGQDLFRSDTRTKTLVEKAYGGLLWTDPATQRTAKLSVGRQNFQLDNGFLLSRFAAGANAGPNPGLYLNPRTAYQMALLAEARAGRLRVEYFDLDPAELKGLDSDTRFQGVHLSWRDADRWDLGATGYRVPESRTTFALPQGGAVPREGQRTWNLRAGHRAVGGIPDLAGLAEFARQDHDNADVSARAWYAQLGYTARRLPWQPSLMLRYASFSGDDPATSTYEAFDAPLSSGLDQWVQGINFKKVVTNRNLNSTRVRLNITPRPGVDYTIDWFRLWADVPLVTGERSYGTELDFAVRWSVTPRLFFLGVAAVAWPDKVIEAQTLGAARPWATVQASLFWNF